MALSCTGCLKLRLYIDDYYYYYYYYAVYNIYSSNGNECGNMKKLLFVEEVCMVPKIFEPKKQK